MRLHAVRAPFPFFLKTFPSFTKFSLYNCNKSCHFWMNGTWLHFFPLNSVVMCVSTRFFYIYIANGFDKVTTSKTNVRNVIFLWCFFLFYSHLLWTKDRKWCTFLSLVQVPFSPSLHSPCNLDILIHELSPTFVWMMMITFHAIVSNYAYILLNLMTDSSAKWRWRHCDSKLFLKINLMRFYLVVLDVYTNGSAFDNIFKAFLL